MKTTRAQAALDYLAVIVPVMHEARDGRYYPTLQCGSDLYEVIDRAPTTTPETPKVGTRGPRRLLRKLYPRSRFEIDTDRIAEFRTGKIYSRDEVTIAPLD